MVSTVMRLELGYGARSGGELREGMRRPPIASMPVEYPTPAIEERAVEVQALLIAEITGREGGLSYAGVFEGPTDLGVAPSSTTDRTAGRL